jgi:hypothetical protein
MRIPQTITSGLSISIIATAVILLAAPLAANAGGTVRDHRTPPTVNDHRKQVRDHRAPVPPAKGGGVSVTSAPHKDDAFWP